MKWLKKNWFILALGILVIILFGDRACKSSSYKKDIAKSDEKISVLEADNEKLEGVVLNAFESAKESEGIVAEKEADIKRKDLVIKSLRKKRVEVVEVVMKLPPSELVEETKEALDCEEIQLVEEGVLFSIECARESLTINKQFSLLSKELEETQFSLTASLEATHFQKLATWNVYRVAWAQGSQILNYQEIGREKDLKFDLCEKQQKKSYWSGLKIGLAIGAGITVTFVIIIPAIKAIF